MPTFILGQQNLAGLTNAGVYIGIKPPTPFINGVPTNRVGHVGIAQWGPVGVPVYFSTPDDCKGIFGYPAVRTYDLPTYVWAESQVGNNQVFVGVRVTDGTDAAATNTIGAAGTYATGYATFSGQPSVNDTLTINGVVYTFTALNIGSTLANTLAVLLETLQLSNSGSLTVASYSLSGGNQLNVTYNSVGTGGNSFTLAKSSSAITLSGATLSGGAGTGGTGLTLTSKYTGSLANGTTFGIATGTAANSYALIVAFPGQRPEIFNNITGAANAFWVNAANAINNGNQYRGPSNYITATAGASVAAPTLTGSSPVVLSGGTDGATSVNTAAMLGQDTVPRKGMYALRKTGCDSAALCDVVDTTSWAAQDAFGLSENIYMQLTTANGDTISNCVATRTSAGLDDFPSKLTMGDWPYFYDTYNGYERVCSPQAFALGMFGNLSPQFSTLNQRIGGVVATQRSNQSNLFSDAELSVANLGGIDLIVPPGNALGGQYFCFITGRNASSNTAGNGDEYTRMTFFIARSLQGPTTGQFIGKLQSTQANDPLRQNVKFVLDSFMQNLVDLDMIDNYACQCDLTNNTANLIAQGYLIAYVAARYLATVRYFVIELAGGSNVNVTSSATPPSNASGSILTFSQFTP